MCSRWIGGYRVSDEEACSEGGREKAGVGIRDLVGLNCEVDVSGGVIYGGVGEELSSVDNGEFVIMRKRDVRLIFVPDASGVDEGLESHSTLL